MRYFPSSLLGRNVALLLATVLISQVVAVTSFVVFLQRPRIQDAAGFFASQIGIIDQALGDLPEAQRHAYLAKLFGTRRAPADSRTIDDVYTHHPFANIELHAFLHALSQDLSENVALRLEPGSPPRLWVGFVIVGQQYWVPLSVARASGYPGLWVAVASSLVLSGLATVAAFAIHRRMNRPLADLVAAANVVGRGKWPDPVTERGTKEIVQLSQTFNAMTTRLAESEAARAAMLAGISHDIRTPLTKLRLAMALQPRFMDASLTSQSFDSDVEDETEIHGSQCQALDPERYIDAILQQFIDFARGTEGEPRTVGDVNAVIQQLAADFAGLGHPFELHLSAIPTIPFGQTSMLRLLMNLMENAVHYGGIGLAVSTICDGTWVSIEILDRGPGVAKSFLPLLFHPFRRGDATRKKEGSGLGLAIAKRIAVEHGGDLTAHARQRGGMAFHVRLPTKVI